MSKTTRNANEIERLERSIRFFEHIIAETQPPVYFHAYLNKLKRDLEIAMK